MIRKDVEVIMAYFSLLPQHFPGRTREEEPQEILSQDSNSSGQDSNLVLPKHKTGVLNNCKVW
jgi:hypothetical protein